MIFDRKVYRKINFFSSLKKRFSILNLSSAKINEQRVEILYPTSIKDIDIQRVDYLNKHCHSDAFLVRYKKIYIELSKCNSCRECQKFDGIIFNKIQDVDKIVDSSLLPLDR